MYLNLLYTLYKWSKMYTTELDRIPSAENKDNEKSLKCETTLNRILNFTDKQTMNNR